MLKTKQVMEITTYLIADETPLFLNASGVSCHCLLPFWFWPMFTDINESLGTHPVKAMESRHCRSKPQVEATWSLIINSLLLHSNALNKIKEHRACLVIYFLALHPAVKIISKKSTSALFSLSEFKLQNFWARLSGNLAEECNGSQVFSATSRPQGELLANTLHLEIDCYHLKIIQGCPPVACLSPRMAINVAQFKS